MKKLMLEIIIFVLGFMGVQTFTNLHTLLLRVDPVTFGRTCALVTCVVLIYVKNRKSSKDHKELL